MVWRDKRYLVILTLIVIPTMLYVYIIDGNIDHYQPVISSIQVSQSLHDSRNHNVDNHTTNQPLTRQSDMELLLAIIQNNSFSCEGMVKPSIETIQYRNLYWQLQEEPALLLAYSAIYDDRKLTGDLPVIRITAVASTYYKHLSLIETSYTYWYYFQVWYDNMTQPYIHRARVNRVGWHRKIDSEGKSYLAILITCDLPVADIAPSYVGLVPQPCNTSRIFLPVTYPDHTMRHQFGVCVPASYGSIPQSQFIEWMEFHRILGVTEFSVYNGSLTSDLRGIFDYYEQKGILLNHPISSPTVEIDTYGVKTGMLAGMNDCMLRNMHRYQFIITIDFDEIIIPHFDSNYTMLLKRINQMMNLTQNWHIYSFQNVFHFFDLPEDKRQPAHLQTMRFRYHQRPGGYRFRSKSFLDPRQCFSVFNHYCLVTFHGMPPEIDVNTSIALNHHYRDCPFTNAKECEGIEAKPHDAVLGFQDLLRQRVEKVYSDLNIDMNTTNFSKL